jgi:hypothetical protein
VINVTMPWRRIAIISAGLILVSAVIVIVTPKLLRAPGYRQEMAAVKAISTVHIAEIQYHSKYGNYATTLSQFGPPASGSPGPNGADLIDRDLASGDKGGFRLVLQPTPTGYSVTANPAAFRTGGSHSYFSDQSMSIHQHNGQDPATANDPVLD